MIRPATMADADVIRACTRAAFGRYVVRMNREPAPMQADLAPAIARGEVHVATGPDGVHSGPCHLPQGGARHGARHFGGLAGPCGAPVWASVWLRIVETLARQQGLETVTLYTNAAMVENLPFYAGLGYSCTGRNRQDGFDRVFFRKPLG